MPASGHSLVVQYGSHVNPAIIPLVAGASLCFSALLLADGNIEMAAPELPSWRQGITDEDIVAQANQLQADISAHQPLVGEREAVDVLIQEYMENPAFLPKVGDVMQRYAALRRMRGDGNCFYRSLMVALGEQFVAAGVRLPKAGSPSPASTSPLQANYERIVELARASMAKLVSLGVYPKETTEDFYTVFVRYIEGLGAEGATVETHALGPLRADDSFYAIYFTRLLCGYELRTNSDEYLPYILGTSECATVEQFVETSVDTSSTDADMVQMMALCRALGVAVRVAYIDATPGDHATTVDIPDGAPAGTMTLDLLYRPGHYDVLYKA